MGSAPSCDAATVEASTKVNRAFVFIKPHASNDAVEAAVKAKFGEKGIKILGQGVLGGAEIDEKKHIDKHYYAIASKATLLDPSELVVPEDKFEEKFGLSWKSALETKKAANAMQACERLKLSPDELQTMWKAVCGAGGMIKFGGGFYCGKIEKDGEALYVFNPFFMAMRSKFCAPEAQIRWFDVEFDVASLSWADFRGSVLGPTDPAKAPDGSLRKQIFDDWEKLGLAAQPDNTDNGVHASASPFEALAERANWLTADVEADSYGKALLACGVPKDTILAWTVDPRVPLGTGKDGSIFDALEDLNANDCLFKAIHYAQCA